MTYMVTYVTCQTKKLTSPLSAPWQGYRSDRASDTSNPLSAEVFRSLDPARLGRYGRSVSRNFHEVIDA
jgi:hypothetical protein